MNSVVITDLAPHIHEVRVHRGDGRHFDACFNVTEIEGGRTLKVSMFLARDGSPPPSVRWFRAFAAAHFPRADTVAGDHRTADGSLRPWRRRFRGESLAARFAFALSAAMGAIR